MPESMDESNRYRVKFSITADFRVVYGSLEEATAEIQKNLAKAMTDMGARTVSIIPADLKKEG